VSASLGGRYAVFKRSLLWRRLDGVLASASLSLEGVRRFGLPASVPSQVAWLPHLTPPSLNGRAPFLPVKEPGQIFVGFAGRITAAKGWRVLLEAMHRLPGEFQVLLAGGGEEEEDLRAACAAGDLRGRARVLGVLEKENLWAFYRSLDVLVLPSVSTPQWTEQFGSVMAEAMACGVPVIGSSSGAIPEVLGGCGVVVPENDAAALAQAIRELADDPQRCKALADKGRQRFEEKFTIARYAERVAAALGLQP
jgi:glycosyltransferase involved in cell wall biosynthesis